MPYREFHYHWEWEFKSSPDVLWPFVSDTNRYNRDVGAPPLDSHISKGRDMTNRRRLLRMSYFGVPVEYDEEPFEWIRPYRFGVFRRFSKGPVTYMRIAVELKPTPQEGTRLIFEITSQPRSLLGVIAIPVQIGLIAARALEKAFRTYDEFTSQGKPPFELKAHGQLAPGGRSRLPNLRKTLSEQGASPHILEHLINTIENSDDLSLARIRPYALADYWGVPRRDVLELCLLATRAGLLDFQWDLLCPLCRGTQESSSSLKDIHTHVHCDSCNIDFTVNFDRLVEVTFKPNPAVRLVENREFCVGGPQVTPHIVVQQLLSPHDQRSLTPILEPGRYRLRTYGLPGGQFLAATQDGNTAASFRAEVTGWPSEEVRVATTPTLQFENATDSEQLFVLERMAWTDQAATAAEVIALQRFRDLFSSEVLRPGEQISVGSLSILFTDLRDSTRLYREIGDAPAFGCVVNHFDILREAIRAEDGSLVKTMGDAVMAVFRRPPSALRAIMNAQKVISSVGNNPPLQLKAGIHYGPCIAVTLNERLDYFGSTVNIAARLEGLSKGGDVIISSAIRYDPEVMDLLTEQKEKYMIESIEATLKGFETERFELWRIKSINGGRKL